MFEGLAIGVVTIVAGAIGYFADRWIRRSSGQERADRIIQTLELKRRLREEGLSIEEADAFASGVMQGRYYFGPREIGVLNQPTIEPTAPLGEAVVDDTADFGFADTTAGMRLGLGNRLAELEGQMAFALAELKHRASPVRVEAYDVAQRAWEQFACKEAEAAALLFEGGTGAPLLGLGRRISLAEQRLNNLRQQLKEEGDL